MAAEVTISLKGGKGYESPWIVVKADSVTEAIRALDDLVYDDVPRRVSKASKHFQGVLTDE